MAKDGERTLAALVLLADIVFPCAALGAQQLIPVPYPEMLGPNAQIGGGAPETHQHQHLIPDPVPQAHGRNALGNPGRFHRHKHQHLLPTPYWRQYHRWRENL